MRRTKSSATKTLISCPNIIRFYNNVGLDIMDQKTAAYKLDRKSKHYFYLKMFFDLIDGALVNSHTA